MPDWTEEQRQCFEKREGTLLVSAAAGSGKTTVMIERIMERLKDAAHPTDLNRLLIVTFTRAAAAEMRARLSRSIEAYLSEHPDDAGMRRQLLLLPRAPIGTVDSFCGTLLREHFDQVDLSAGFTVAEEDRTAPLLSDAVQETVRAFQATDNADFHALYERLSNGKSEENLNGVLLKLYRNIASQADPEHWLQNTEALLNAEAPILQTVWGTTMQKALLRRLDMLAENYRLLSEEMSREQPRLYEALSAFLEREAETLCAVRRACTAAATWEDLCAAVLSVTFADKPRVKQQTEEEKAFSKKRVDAVRGDAKKALTVAALGGDADACRQDFAYQKRFVAVIYAMVRQLQARYTAKKRERNWLDFSDVEHLTLQLLTARNADTGQPEPTALAREISAEFDEIMVDEYQDTNPAQNALYRALSRNGENLFFVGDVKQSIYSFRHATPQSFLDLQEILPRFDGECYPGLIRLDHNFRSRRTVVDAVNSVFDRIMVKELGGIDYRGNERLQFAARDYPADDDAGYEPELLLAVDGADGSETDPVKREALLIASRIRESVGHLTVTVKGVSRPLCYGDCCILLRTFKGVAPVIRDTLTAVGIPAVCSKSDGEFFDAPEVQAAMSLLEAIENPLRDVPLAAAMLSPVGGFTPDDLAAIRVERRRGSLYAAVAFIAASPQTALSERCAAWLRWLDRWRTRSVQLTADKLLLLLYEETHLPELVRARTGGESQSGNLMLLLDLCRQFDDGGFRGLPAFLHYARRLREAGTRLPMAQPEAADAVRIETVHGAKGLEYPVVFYTGIHRGFNTVDDRSELQLMADVGVALRQRDPDTLFQQTGFTFSALKEASHLAMYAEELRILYVALTRAREKLYVVGSLKKAETALPALAACAGNGDTVPLWALCKAKSPQEWILAALLRHPRCAALRANVAQALPLYDDAAPWQVSIERVSPAQTVTAVPAACEPDAALTAAIRERMAYVYPHAALARVPSKLAASDTAHRALSHRFVATSRPAFAADRRLTPTERGTAMHTFMQFADYAAAATAPEAEIDRLTQNGFLSAVQAEVLDREKLAAFFGSALYARLSASPYLLREYKFTTLLPASATEASVTEPEEYTVVQGIADCVFEENGALVIVDYKTDRVSSPEELCDRYRAQLSVYRRALENALALPVRECLLYSFALGATIPVEC